MRLAGRLRLVGTSHRLFRAQLADRRRFSRVLDVGTGLDVVVPVEWRHLDIVHELCVELVVLADDFLDLPV